MKFAKAMKKNRFRNAGVSPYRLKNVDAANVAALSRGNPVPRMLRWIRAAVRAGLRVGFALGYTVLFFSLEIFFEDMSVSAMSRKQFSIQKVEIENNVLVSRQRILEAIRLPTDHNIILCDLERIRDKVSRIENVTGVTVSRHLPGTLAIRISERTPRFRMEIGGELIDSRGDLVRLENGYRVYKHLPVLKGFALTAFHAVAETDLPRFERVVELAGALARSPEGRGRVVKKIDAEEEWVDFYLETGTCVRIPYVEERSALDRLWVVLGDLDRKGCRARRIDLRFENVIVKVQ